METPELPIHSPAPSGAEPTVQELAASLRALRSLFIVTLVIILVGSLGVNVMLFRQVSTARRQVEELDARLKPINAQYDNVVKPRVSAFLNALVGYAQTHPDFAQILQKYPIQGTPGQAAPR